MCLITFKLIFKCLMQYFVLIIKFSDNLTLTFVNRDEFKSALDKMHFLLTS